MKQTLHIFAKDARRFWPEIAISIVIAVAFARIYPNQWLAPDQLFAVSGWGGFAGPQGLQLLASMLTVLVPVSWLLLIARVIHGESLVGDRRFWLTRPYEWKQLLAAKVLFLFVFLYLPFVAAQLALLAEAGFQPFSYMPGLLYNLLLITGALVMPLFAMATVTSTFARMALTVVGVLLGFIGFGVLSARLTTSAVSPPSSGDFSIPILLCVCGGTVALQYAARLLWLSRLLLIGLLLTIGVAMLTPSDGRAIDHAYAAKAGHQESPIQVALLQDANHQITGVPLDAKQIQINIPVQISGVTEGSMMIPDIVRVSVEAANGFHWTSPWQAIYRTHYLPGPQESSVAFNIDRSVYEKVKSAPVQLHLILALTQAQAGEATRVPLPATDFFVPGFGICSPERGWPEAVPNVTGISCRSAFRQPNLTYVETLWSNRPCSGVMTEPNTGVQGAAWAGDLDSAPAQFGITSVWTVLVSLSNSFQYTGERYRPDKPRYLCPGTPVTFTRYGLVKRLQTEVVIPNFQMPAKISPEGYVQVAQ
jgi:hypothetical protein